MRHMILAALAAAAFVAGCGGDDKSGSASTGSTPAATTKKIQIKDFLFDPDPATVKVGQKIAITNADTAPHTVTEDGPSKSFDSGTIKGGQEGSVTFTKAGTFKYFCEFHATMKGTVTVTG